MDDVPLLIFASERESNTRKFRLLAALVILEIVFILGFTIFTFVLPSVHHSSNDYFVLVYSHVAFWGFAMLLERVLRDSHKKLKVTGYFVVHKKTRKFNKTLGLTLAAGNLLLLTLSTVYLNFCTSSPCDQFSLFGIYLKRINYVQIIVMIEILVAMPIMLWYLAVIVKLIGSNALPDVLREDRMFSFPQRDVALVGRRNGCVSSEELLERQANVIQCLQERNVYLATKIQALQRPCESV